MHSRGHELMSAAYRCRERADNGRHAVPRRRAGNILTRGNVTVVGQYVRLFLRRRLRSASAIGRTPREAEDTTAGLLSRPALIRHVADCLNEISGSAAVS